MSLTEKTTRPIHSVQTDIFAQVLELLLITYETVTHLNKMLCLIMEDAVTPALDRLLINELKLQ